MRPHPPEVRRMLIAARQMIASPDAWIRYQRCFDYQGCVTDPHDDLAAQWDLGGAMECAAHEWASGKWNVAGFRDPEEARRAAEYRLLLVVAPLVGDRWIAKFNDLASHEAVLRVLDAAILGAGKMDQ